MKGFHRNLLIVANAGSGKTHRLVTRCIQLLQRGAAPEQILALTFTRAAAAEFLQKLFARLAQAAGDAVELRKLQADLADSPSLDAAGCTALMRRLVEALPRLSMGTLDQYFGRVVRAFPFELGLAREMELLDDAEREENQVRALEQLFAQQATVSGLGEFINLLRQQNRNRAERSALDGISRDVAALQEKFLETPSSARWGDEETIWPDGCAILNAGDVATTAGAFREAVAATNPQLGEDAKAVLNRWLEAAVAHQPPRRMGGELVKFFEKLSDAGLGKGKSDTPYIPVGGRGDAKSLFLRGLMRGARDNLRRAILKLELQSRLGSSRALYDTLEKYEGIYNRTVRQAGFLTFNDLILLLAVNQERISHQHIEYRLDGRHDHWLLDEFQDTSRLQWRVLEPLAQEVICDSGEQRSFFYVGDAKQAIYGWRGGDFELFQQVRDKFKGSTGDHIAREDLPYSYRSDRAIVGVVNGVFAPARLKDPANADFRLPEEMVSNWEKAWVDHKPLDAAREGFAKFQILTQNEEDEDGQAALDRAVLEILKETDPIGRGMNCAIIVRTRDALDHYVTLLRGQKTPIPVAAQGRVNPCLNSLEGMVLFSLAKYLASPADTVARGHFLASPLGFLAGRDPAEFHLAALQSLAANGFAATFAGWIREASARSLINATNAAAFIEAASDYDTKRAAGSDLLRFVRFIEHREQQDGETTGVVRVMTVHFSKGLGMDMVILPELRGKGLGELHDTSGMTVRRDKEGRIRWGLALPSDGICAEDGTLSEAREHLRAREAYEKFCVLYVAMTRAKHALYCLHVRGRDIKNSGRWLEKNFPASSEGDSSIRSLGNPRWFEDFTFRDAGGREIVGTSIKSTGAASRAAVPSFHEGADIPAELLFAGGSARSLGSWVHEILARIEWLGEPPDFTGADEQAARLVRGFLEGEGASIFTRPAGDVMLWRERAFDVEIDGCPVSGVFDRVHIIFGADGKPLEACVYDFKTSAKAADLNKKYGAQLETYRKAAANLLGLDAAKVRAELGVIQTAD